MDQITNAISEFLKIAMVEPTFRGFSLNGGILKVRGWKIETAIPVNSKTTLQQLIDEFLKQAYSQDKIGAKGWENTIKTVLNLKTNKDD